MSHAQFKSMKFKSKLKHFDGKLRTYTSELMKSVGVVDVNVLSTAVNERVYR